MVKNSRTLRHMHIPNTALHFQAYASVQQGIPAFSHRDKTAAPLPEKTHNARQCRRHGILRHISIAAS